MRDHIMRKAWIMRAMKSCLAAMMFCVAIAPASSSAAVNLIENGDFEMDATGAVSTPLNYVYANNGNKQGQPQGWTLSPTSRFGLVNEGTDRHAVSDLLGAHTLFFERRKNEKTLLEATQTFTVPAPGKYRLTLNYMGWNFDTSYGFLKVFASVISPDGAVTNSLAYFTPHSYAYGLESVGSFMCDTAVLADGPVYTLRLYATDSTGSSYAYNIIDNVSLSLHTLVLGDGETFSCPFGLEPENIQLGAGAIFKYDLSDRTTEIVSGKLTFVAGSKLMFDMTEATADAYVLRTGGIVLPEGEIEPLMYIGFVSGGDYSPRVMDDGKTIVVEKPGAVVSTTWTGGGDAANLTDPANWSDMPSASTLAITLGADADWRGCGALPVSPAATIDMNGKSLKLSGLTPVEFTGAAITNSASGEAAGLTIDVASGENENTSVEIGGNVRLVKDGTGTFKASRKGQRYWGGTAVNAGTLKLGVNARFLPLGGPGENLIENGEFATDKMATTKDYLNLDAFGDVDGWTISSKSSMYIFNSYFYWSQYDRKVDFRDPQYEWDMFSLSIGWSHTVSQTFRVVNPGTYRFAFEYGAWVGGSDYNGPTTDVSISNGDGALFNAQVTPVTETGFRQFFADVEIATPGDHTLTFATASNGWWCHVDHVIFGSKCEIAVGEGATLDMNGHEGYGMYSVNLAGGTIKNANGEVSADKIGFPYVALSADSTLQPEKYCGIVGFRAAAATIDLGGKTLDVPIPIGGNLALRDAVIKNGTFNTTSGGWLSTTGEAGIDATTADFNISCALRINAPIAVHDYKAVYSANYNEGSAAMKVFGTFTPQSAYFYGCTMQDGSTIDLSAKVDAWSTTSSFTGGRKTLDFAPNATVKIEVGERELAIGEKVVSWASMPPVEDNVSFELVRGGVVSETHALAVQADGLYVKRAAEPAYATWDVDASKWRFYTAGDVEVADWEDGVTANMQVRFSSYEEYVAIAAQNVVPSAFVATDGFALPGGDGEIALTAFVFEYPAGMTIDLNGRTLKLPEWLIGGSKASTVTSSEPGAVLVADIAGNVNNASMTIDGPVKLLKTGAGTLTASKRDQTYTGGTEVANGVLKCGINGYDSSDAWPFGRMPELLQNGSFDEDAGASWYGATGWTASPGNWCGRQPAGSYCSNKLPVGKFAMVGGSQRNGGAAAQFYQSVEISDPGMYRYSFNHARRSADLSVAVDVLLVHDGVERLLVTVTPMSVESFTKTSGYVKITEAGTYTLKFAFHKTPSALAQACYNIFDNVSLVHLREVKVTGADSVLDMNGRYWLYHYLYLLDGGTLRNAGGNPGDSRSKIQCIELAADSIFDLVNTYGVHGEGADPARMFMGGHALTAIVGNGQTFWINSTVMEGEGLVDVPVTTGTLRVCDQGNKGLGVVATNVDFSVGCALNLTAPMDVRGYEAKYDGTSNAGTAALNVFGVFRPVVAGYYGCTLQDGATLDLSGWAGEWPWNVTSAFTTGANTVSFAAGATIKLRLGDRTTPKHVVEWTEETKPANYDTLTFVRDPSDARRYYVRKGEDGVYIIGSGSTIIIR